MDGLTVVLHGDHIENCGDGEVYEYDGKTYLVTFNEDHTVKDCVPW